MPIWRFHSNTVKTLHKVICFFIESIVYPLNIEPFPIFEDHTDCVFCVTAALSSFHNRLSPHLKRLGSLVIGRVGGPATSADPFRSHIPLIANSSTIIPTAAIYNPFWQLTTITIAAMCHWVYTPGQVYPFVVDL